MSCHIQWSCEPRNWSIIIFDNRYDNIPYSNTWLWLVRTNNEWYEYSHRYKCFLLIFSRKFADIFVWSVHAWIKCWSCGLVYTHDSSLLPVALGLQHRSHLSLSTWFWPSKIISKVEQMIWQVVVLMNMSGFEVLILTPKIFLWIFKISDDYL